MNEISYVFENNESYGHANGFFADTYEEQVYFLNVVEEPYYSHRIYDVWIIYEKIPVLVSCIEHLIKEYVLYSLPFRLNHTHSSKSDFIFTNDDLKILDLGVERKKIYIRINTATGSIDFANMNHILLFLKLVARSNRILLRDGTYDQ